MKAQPINKLIVQGRNNVPLELDVYAETDWLAVTLENEFTDFAITHKPTGMVVQKTNWSLAEAKQALKRIAAANIDWDWGQDWSSRKRHSPALIKKDKKAAAAREAFIAQIKYA